MGNRDRRYPRDNDKRWGLIGFEEVSRHVAIVIVCLFMRFTLVLFVKTYLACVTSFSLCIHTVTDDVYPLCHKDSHH